LISRTLFFIFVMVPLLVLLVPVQFVITRLGLYWSLPARLFHKVGCRFLGLRVRTIGRPLQNQPVLMLANHISWTDIIAIGSVADVTFVAKTGVRNTFFVGFMASLQRTLFVDYNRRTDAKRTSAEMARRATAIWAHMSSRSARRWWGRHRPRWKRAGPRTSRSSPSPLPIRICRGCRYRAPSAAAFRA
jgi:1-acyl-sn-glycerol-3-phosphate acyltransferase